MELDYLKKLTESKELQDIEWQLCKNDPYYFLTTWAFTLDAHDEDNLFKPFPKKAYIEYIVDAWKKYKLIAVPKSRQMLVSWVCVGLCLHDTQFNSGKLTLIQSKKADDANDMVKRAKIIWDNEPSFLKRYKDDEGNLVPLVCNPQNQGNSVYNLMAFPDNYSEIRGIPAGGDVIRLQTASNIFCDEAAFQAEASEAYTAAKPTVSSKGRFVMVSTADDGSFFEDVVFDLLEM